ncbi:hypothetical protein GGQ85_000192 [Nitrobacter vulgaris]|uniref:hypothetical protein n=1 Tax=Nitrobacter vulgaris TaxID=29421 RepID=UPI0028645ADC|nr:hypothetical protein [Nitrobacter vulgaris]MDR6302521.1 hypothetical protein [Nitrobacter vulgaris]
MTTQQHANASARAYSQPPSRTTDANIVVSEFPLNAYQRFRAEIVMRNGKPTVALSRWKITAAGARRTGQTFEFGAHRIAAIAGLLAEVQRVVDTLNEAEAS